MTNNQRHVSKAGGLARDRWPHQRSYLVAIAAFAVLLCDAVPVDGKPSAPQDPYVLPGYVPVGFASFGKWTARRQSPLFKAPGSHVVVASVDACEQVTAEDGQLRGRPWAIRVVKNHPPFHTGETMWILARDLEEGYFQLWYRGQVRDELSVALEDDIPFAQEHCRKPMPKCWLWVGSEVPQEHWIRMRRKDGTVGWSKRADDFAESRAEVKQCL